MSYKNLSLPVILLFVGLILPQSVIGQSENATLGGYGELHYNDIIYDENEAQTPGRLDFHRFALTAGYNFNDWISFRSQINLRHALLEAENDGDAAGGQIALHQAYVDLSIKPGIGVRAGLLLIPAGIINQSQDPSSFNGVERPNVEHFIIPTTWREAGIGIYGQPENGVTYELYVMAGLDAGGIGETGIRDARQKGVFSSTDNVAAAGRLEYKPIPELKLGMSYFVSDLSTNAAFGDNMLGTTFHLGTFHAIFQKEGFEARLLGAYGLITKVDQLNSTYGNDAGESQYGAYLELGYDLLRLGNLDTGQQLILFGRGEIFNSQFTTVGLTADPENERYEYTGGFTYKPTARVAFKADYQLFQSAGDKNIHQLNIGVGYSF